MLQHCKWSLLLNATPLIPPLLLLSTIIGPPFRSARTNLLLTQSLTLRCFTFLQSQLESKYKELAKARKFAELYFQHSCIHLQDYAMLGHHQYVCPWTISASSHCASIGTLRLPKHTLQILETCREKSLHQTHCDPHFDCRHESLDLRWLYRKIITLSVLDAQSVNFHCKDFRSFQKNLLALHLFDPSHFSQNVLHSAVDVDRQGLAATSTWRREP
jgi:hypothetical protein